ncbi:GntR family transcriptional regulator [Paraburkholderia eburnea]|uniref:GntR family transcriptional regulator n=1 Tax=Paraburkholderia eburnea TaxID=1189126 RepID=A0A2S4M7T3_9BURK|nr:GntR family transcriptional regulator [Paraburkholderia eburnea]POR50587.1 GntR family transcriptional regulator [Paraburkholderia eburnea]PRZ21355.1 GntR family transcriptional regulator [Paraburkholderia eburnea]
MTTTTPVSQEDAVLAALSGFKANPEQSYRPQVHQFLRDTIVRGVLPPHTSLSEAAISDALEVSRTPVREALAQLADEHLVNIYRKVGTIVAPISVSQLEEGRFARSTLECANHVQLAQTITPQQLTEFGQIVEHQREAVAAGDVDHFFSLDELMHRRLFEFAGRAHVWEMLQPMKRQFDRVRWLLLDRVVDHAERALREHELILAHVASRNIAQLGATVASHIDRVGSHLPEVRGRVPDYFVD